MSEAETHEVDRINDWDREFYCPVKNEAHSFEKGMGYEYCPFCGAELV